ncbi:Gfo/Idh/MocA family protein [Actinomadura roseirufa]|uniref:Gfo/Idh/MocA family protein n=1 Tax=Actinomadura roseirufa TaxID=2094049 RepID=UPI001040ED59|nr:Gfo/Idh/MocA family oxidoreductase [Actinomadura roseirufa]
MTSITDSPAAPAAARTAADLRVGILGAGFMARVHAAAVRRAGAKLVTVTASSPERSRAAALELGAEHASTDAEAVIGSEDVDVVHVCVPNHLHEPLVTAALAAGKHVVCEKPLATGADAARRMRDLAAARGLVGTVAFVYRYNPAVFEARARIAAGSLGRVNLIHGGYLQDWLAEPDDTDWRLNPALGGSARVFGDIGTHWCDLAEFVTGERITRVLARGDVTVERAADDHDATHDQLAVIFQTRGGATGVAALSQAAPGHKNDLRLEVSGSRATTRFELDMPGSLWWATRGADRRLWPRADRDARGPGRIVTVPAGHPQGFQDALDLLVADTYAQITALESAGGAPPDGLPTFEDGARAVMVMDAVTASAASGTWVEVEA